MLVRTLLRHLNAVAPMKSVQYMNEITLGNQINYWEIVVGHGAVAEHCYIRLIDGIFVVDNFIYKNMEVIGRITPRIIDEHMFDTSFLPTITDELTEGIARVQLAMKISIQYNLN